MPAVQLPDWSGRKVVCLASGPSLTEADVGLVRAAGHPTVVANNTFRLAPWADLLFAHDSSWWTSNNEKGEQMWKEVERAFSGQRTSSSQVLTRNGVATTFGVAGYRDFHNSGANCISLAIAAGAGAVVLLGFDCQFAPDGRKHWHADHPKGKSNCLTIKKWPSFFAKVAEHAKARGVRVMNASRATALTCFPRIDLQEALA